MPNVSQNNMTFPFGPALPGSMSFVAQAGTELSAQAAEIESHSFLFWHINNGTSKTVSTNNSFSETIGTQPFSATAWYVHRGSNGTCIAIRPYAYSITSNSTLNESPIESVAPQSAWSGTGDSTVDVDQNNVQITAKATLNGEDFQSWLIFGNATANGRVLNVPQGHCPIVIATYKKTSGGVIFPPVIELEDLLGRLGRHIFPGGGVIDPAPIDILRLRELLAKGLLSGSTTSAIKSTTAGKAATKKTAKKATAKKVKKTLKKNG